MYIYKIMDIKIFKLCFFILTFIYVIGQESFKKSYKAKKENKLSYNHQYNYYLPEFSYYFPEPNITSIYNALKSKEELNIDRILALSDNNIEKINYMYNIKKIKKDNQLWNKLKNDSYKRRKIEYQKLIDEEIFDKYKTNNIKPITMLSNKEKDYYNINPSSIKTIKFVEYTINKLNIRKNNNVSKILFRKFLEKLIVREYFKKIEEEELAEIHKYKSINIDTCCNNLNENEEFEAYFELELSDIEDYSSRIFFIKLIDKIVENTKIPININNYELYIDNDKISTLIESIGFDYDHNF